MPATGNLNRRGGVWFGETATTPLMTNGGTVMNARILTAPIALAAGIGLSTTASAAPAETTAREPAFVTSAVVSDSLRGIPGNQHQVLIDKSHRNEIGGWVRSWSCPPGATVSMSWVSSRCDHRLTQDLRPRWGTDPEVRLSSTTRSARIAATRLVGVNRDTGYRRTVPVVLSVVARPDAQLIQEADARFWDPSRAWGYVGTRPYWDPTGAWVGYR